MEKLQDKEKIFVIGFQKTGTTSVEQALINLNYKVLGGDKHLLDFQKSKDLDNYIIKLLEHYDAVQDMPWPLFYKELYGLYPNAKFILTKRSTKKWIESVVRYFASVRIPMHQKIYGVPCAEGYEKRYVEIYESHNQNVIEFFQGKSNFLIMEQEENFNYASLCEFLDIKTIPNETFPHARNNKKRQLPKYKLYRNLRSFYWNFKKKY